MFGEGAAGRPAMGMTAHCTYYIFCVQRSAVYVHLSYSVFSTAAFATSG
jgi:hypothetical protein